MKNSLKKLVSLLTVFVMVLGLVPAVMAATYSDVTEADTEAVNVLSAFKILQGYPDGTFGGDKTITRAEFAAVADRLLGYEDLSKVQVDTIFPDVPASHWASGYVMTAQQQGVIQGFPDGNFYPENPVTYEQAVTMLMRALGYEPMASETGYPAGYLYAAQQAGVTAGAYGVIGEAATRSLVANLTYRALDAKIMERDTYGTGDKEYSVKAITASERFLNAEKLVKAEVTKSQYTGGKEGKVNVAGYTVSEPIDGTPSTTKSDYIDACGVADLEGYKLTLYASTSSVASAERKIIAASADISGALVIDARQIVSITNSGTPVGAVTTEEVTYYPDPTSNNTKTFIINDTIEAKLNAAIAAEDAKIVLYNDAKDAGVDYDWAVVEEYTTYVVKSNNGKSLKDDGVIGSLDADFKDYDKNKKDNRYIGFDPATLEEGDVVTFQTKGQGAINYYIGTTATTAVEGKVTKVFDTSFVDGRILIDGELYYVVDGKTDNDDDIAKNVTGAFVINPNGKVVSFEKEKGSLGDFRAFVSAGSKAIVLWENGEEVEYDFAKDVLVDGIKRSASQAVSDLSGYSLGLLGVVFDGDVVTEINLAVLGVGGDEDIQVTQDSTASYKASNNRFYYGNGVLDAASANGYVTVDSSTAVYAEVKGLGMIQIDLTALADDQSFGNVELYNVKDKKADAIFLSDADIVLRDSSAKMVYVTTSSLDKNDDNEKVTFAWGYDSEGWLGDDGVEFLTDISLSDDTFYLFLENEDGFYDAVELDAANVRAETTSYSAATDLTTAFGTELAGFTTDAADGTDIVWDDEDGMLVDGEPVGKNVNVLCVDRNAGAYGTNNALVDEEEAFAVGGDYKIDGDFVAWARYFDGKLIEVLIVNPTP